MAAQRLWIIERKYHRPGRKWESSLDAPFINEAAAHFRAAERQAENPGWAYRAVLFIRAYH